MKMQFKCGLFTSLLLFVALFSVATPATAASIESVALDPVSGDTFMIQQSDNPNGNLILLNDNDLNFRKTIQVAPGTDSSAHFEVALITAKQVAVLISNKQEWSVSELTQNAESKEWTLSTEPKLSGKGYAKDLTVFPGSTISLQITENDQPQNSSVVLFNAAPGSSSYVPLASVSSEQLSNLLRAEVKKANTVLTTEKQPDAKPAVVNPTDNNQPNNGMATGLGFTAGYTSGVGFAFRHYFNRKWGVQIGGIAFGSPTSINANLGVNVMKTIAASRIGNFYMLAGLGNFYNGSEYPDYTDCKGDFSTACTPTPVWQNNIGMNFGVGIGFEFHFLNTVGVSLELPLSLSVGTENGSSGLKFQSVYPIPNGSLLYYF